jgi:hypothetical protein
MEGSGVSESSADDHPGQVPDITRRHEERTWGRAELYRVLDSAGDLLDTLKPLHQLGWEKPLTEAETHEYRRLADELSQVNSRCAELLRRWKAASSELGPSDALLH